MNNGEFTIWVTNPIDPYSLEIFEPWSHFMCIPGIPIRDSRVTFGKHTKNYGKSACLMGKSTINGPFSIAMLNYQRVIIHLGPNWWWTQLCKPRKAGFRSRVPDFRSGFRAPWRLKSTMICCWELPDENHPWLGWWDNFSWKPPSLWGNFTRKTLAKRCSFHLKQSSVTNSRIKKGLVQLVQEKSLQFLQIMIPRKLRKSRQRLYFIYRVTIPKPPCHYIPMSSQGAGGGPMATLSAEESLVILSKGHHGVPWSIAGGYPLVMADIVYIAIENGHRNRVFSHEKWWFSCWNPALTLSGWRFHAYVLLFHLKCEWWSPVRYG